jgi:hypothetical protein
MKIILVVSALCCLAAGAVSATETVIALSASEIAVVEVEGSAVATGPRVAAFTLPAGIAGVRQAWLELRVDVTATEVGEFRDPEPLFEVYALNAEVTGAIQPKMFREMQVPMSRPVAVGENRLVRIDITEFVQKVLANPTSNHGLAFGAVTTDTRGVFAVRTDGFGPGIAARVMVIE